MAGSDTMTLRDLRTGDLQDWNMDLLHALLTPADVDRSSPSSAFSELPKRNGELLSLVYHARVLKRRSAGGN